MFHYTNSITNKQGDVLPGYYVQAVNPATGLVAPIYSDKSGTPIITASGVANMALVDANGMVSFYITDGNYNVNLYAQDATTLKGNYLDVPMVGAVSLAIGTVSMLSAGAAPTASIDSSSSPAKLNLGLPTTTGAAGAAGTPGANSGTGATAVSRAAMAAIVTPSSLAPLFLTEAGREGLFAFSTANLSAYVTADPNQGVYVAPAGDTSGASGAWVRKSNGQYDIRWFGGVADCTAVGVGTDNSPALNAAITLSKTTGLRQIMIPTGKWRFSSRIALTQGVQIFGDGFHENPGIAGGTTYSGVNVFDGTILVFDQNVGGLIAYSFTDNANASNALSSLGSLGTGSPEYKYKSASGSVFRDFMILGGGGTTVTAHGFEARTIVICENVRVQGFAGNGWQLDADTGGNGGTTPYGVMDGASFYRCHAVSNLCHGFFIRGNDANTLTLIGNSSRSNGGVGYLDVSQLGNSYFLCHTASNNASIGTPGQTISSITNVGTTATLTTSATHGLSTGNVVSVCGASPAQYNVSGVTITVTSTTTFTYTMSGTPGSNATTVGTYYWATSVTPQRTQVLADASWLTDAYAGSYAGTSLVGAHTYTGCYLESGYGRKYYLNQACIVIGGNMASPGNAATGSTLQLNLNGSGVITATEIDSVAPNGTLTFGCGTLNQTATTGSLIYKLNPIAGTYSELQMLSANNLAAGLDILAGSGASYFSSNQFAFRNAAQSSTFFTADATGLRSPLPTGGVGYSTGAGGIVTQATSKATGVTLNKVCGQITLNNASLAANTAVSFVLTNSNITATDVMRVNVASGAATPGSYLVQAEAFGAGSVTISLRNLTAGALAEALVLNFVIVKSVAA